MKVLRASTLMRSLRFISKMRLMICCDGEVQAADFGKEHVARAYLNWSNSSLRDLVGYGELKPRILPIKFGLRLKIYRVKFGLVRRRDTPTLIWENTERRYWFKEK